jgi:TolB-like protein
MKIYLRNLTLLVLLAVGCGGPRSFVHPSTDIGFYKRLGVVNFTNLTADRFAGEKMTSSFVTELLLQKKFEVVEPGEFERIVGEVRGSSSEGTKDLGSEQIKLIGDRAGINGLIEGEVKEFQMTRIGAEDFPLISISIRLVDAPSGQVVWMSSYTEKGGPKFPIFSFGETRTLGELAQKVCKKMVQDFVSRAF